MKPPAIAALIVAIALPASQAFSSESAPDADATSESETKTCLSNYPDVCIAPAPPDLDCKDITHRNFKVQNGDPHKFDGNNNGIGCEEK